MASLLLLVRTAFDASSGATFVRAGGRDAIKATGERAENSGEADAALFVTRHRHVGIDSRV